MKEKHLTLVLNTVLLCIDAAFLQVAYTARVYKNAVIGPFDAAKYLGIILAVLCVISSIQSLTSKSENDNKKVIINNFGLVLLTISATVLLLICWKTFKTFYIFGFLYVLGFLILFGSRDKKITLKRFAFYFILALALIILIYVLFNVLMGLYL